MRDTTDPLGFVCEGQLHPLLGCKYSEQAGGGKEGRQKGEDRKN